MSPKSITTSSDARTCYASLFRAVAELSKLYYGKRPNTKFESIKEQTENLKKDGYLNDYLYDNLIRLYETYPQLVPGKSHAQGWLDNLYTLLIMIIADISEEISDVLNEREKHDTEALWKSLL